MSYYCDICDKTIKHKSKNKHLKSITQNELEESILTKRFVIGKNFFL